ncbi:transposase [Siminovitchia terrae]|uniref:Transposase n=1 Tax=Siminovitchia terrae TaxID=1914933 RepID=A0A429X1F0_SIMTE|nr:RNA-guided endonuclease TnpB family protein [Siminovitchia terrae]RST57262.1 transposase [Siminovitchia terrae]
MFRTLKVGFKANKQIIDRLFDIRRTCGQVWNDCVSLARYYHRLSGKWISKTQLQKELKGLYPIHSQTIQAVAHKYLNACEGTLEARKKGLNTRYPWKFKNQFNPKWVDESFSIKGKKLALSLGNWNGKRQKALVLTLAKSIPFEVKEVELVFDQNLYICLSYDDGKETEENTNTQTAAVDSGEIHTIASVHENGTSIIITGRKLRSIHRLRNKKLRELQKLMSRCKKHSRQWKKYNRAKQYILSKSEKQLKYHLHKTTKQFVEWCVENNTKTILIGDTEGVQKNTKKKRKTNKNSRQKLSNWSFGKINHYIKYKAETYGIKIIKRKELYTSQECPSCGNRKKTKGRVYTCRCGYECHRDLHGAGNILTEYLYGNFRVIKHKDHIYLRAS